MLGVTSIFQIEKNTKKNGIRFQHDIYRINTLKSYFGFTLNYEFE